MTSGFYTCSTAPNEKGGQGLEAVVALGAGSVVSSRDYSDPPTLATS